MLFRRTILMGKMLSGNICLVFSTIAAICLLMTPTLQSVMAVAVLAMCIVVGLSLTKHVVPRVFKKDLAHYGVTCLSLLAGLLMYDSFLRSWTDTGYLNSVATALGCVPELLLKTIGRSGLVAGYYAIYTFISHVAVFLCCTVPSQGKKLMHGIVCDLADWVKEFVPRRTWAEVKENLKKNWFFPISAGAFIFLQVLPPDEYFVMAVVFAIAAFLFAAFSDSLWQYGKHNSVFIRIFSLVSAAGTCWSGQKLFYETWSANVNSVFYWYSTAYWRYEPMVHAREISIICAAAGVYFAYICLNYFWEKLGHFILNGNLLDGVTKKEIVIYAVMVAICVCCVLFIFTNTQAFYGVGYIGEEPIDIVYTSDSSEFIRESVFLNLTHRQNDIKQPLFVLFAAPFVGAPYFISRLFDVPVYVEAILITYVQIILLFVSNFMLAKIMRLTSVKRVCFMLLMFSTYANLLFTVMLEQYIIACFWLVLAIYMICVSEKPDSFVLCAAGGTLLTSFAIVPFVGLMTERKNTKDYMVTIIRSIMPFVLLTVIVRFDVVFNLVEILFYLNNKFAQNGVTWGNKVLQYIAFVASCFFAPAAGLSYANADYPSWQTDPVVNVSAAGVLLLVLIAISAVLNRKKRISMIAAYWCSFSVVLLLVMGWGTVENGLILYSLYFGWAFTVLLFQLAEWITDRLKRNYLLPVLCAGMCLGLLIYNVPAMIDIVKFGITHYPV